jgi:hypothetical protein
MSTKEKILRLINNDVFYKAPPEFFTCGSTDPIYPDNKVPQHHANYYRLYHALADHYQPRRIMEIGVRLGYGIGSLTLGCSTPPDYVEGWDNECYIQASLNKARKNIETLNPPPKSLTLRKLDSQKEEKLLASFDLVSIDGDHTYSGAKHDIEIVAPYCKVMLVDDYHPKNHPGVFRATNEFLAANEGIIKEHFSVTADDFTGQSIKGTYVIEFK